MLRQGNNLIVHARVTSREGVEQPSQEYFLAEGDLLGIAQKKLGVRGGVLLCISAQEVCAQT